MTRNKLIGILPIVIVAAVVLFFVFRDDTSDKGPIAISAQEPTYATLSELAQASDAVVIARATEIREGRVVGSATDPDATIKTQFVTLDVGDVLYGKTDKTITLEEEIALGDGTPIVVNGVKPTQVGNEGVYFIKAAGQELPGTYGLLNGQSRYLVTGPAENQLVSSAADELSLSLAALGPFELRCQVLALQLDAQSAVCR